MLSAELFCCCRAQEKLLYLALCNTSPHSKTYTADCVFTADGVWEKEQREQNSIMSYTYIQFSSISMAFFGKSKPFFLHFSLSLSLNRSACLFLLFASVARRSPIPRWKSTKKVVYVVCHIPCGKCIIVDECAWNSTYHSTNII